MVEPEWPHLQYEKPDFQAISYAASKQKKELASMDEVDPELRKTMDKLGISLEEQKRLSGVAVDCDGQRQCSHVLQGQTRGARHHFLQHERGRSGSPQLVQKYIARWSRP